MTKRLHAKLLLLLSFSFICACQGELSDEDGTRSPTEAWAGSNTPAWVDGSFVYDLKYLSNHLSTVIQPFPWPTDYWPTYQDSINIRWQKPTVTDAAANPNLLSPAEKAARVFNLPDFPTWITNNLGIYSGDNANWSLAVAKAGSAASGPFTGTVTDVVMNESNKLTGWMKFYSAKEIILRVQVVGKATLYVRKSSLKSPQNPNGPADPIPTEEVYSCMVQDNGTSSGSECSVTITTSDIPSTLSNPQQTGNLGWMVKSLTKNSKVTVTYRATRKRCDLQAECNELQDGSICATPTLLTANATAEKRGRCVPGWTGICHGWSRAAVYEPQPASAVTLKDAKTNQDITFYPGDIEGLTAFAYQGSVPLKQLSERCNLAQSTLTLDQANRVVQATECRDMNPGSMFVLLTNMLSMRGTSVVEDRVADLQVWNQPLAGYTVTNPAKRDANNWPIELQEISVQEAMEKLGGWFSFSTLMDTTSLPAGQWKSGTYEATTDGKLLLKMSGTGYKTSLYVKKGAAVTTQDWDCGPTRSNYGEQECYFDVKKGDILNWLLGASGGYSAELKLEVGIPSDVKDRYLYNTNAAKLYYVEMTLHYVSESTPARTAPDLNEHIYGDNYAFILEVDKNGKVIGGEWVGDSKLSHPDFMWWPVAKPTYSQGGFTYEMLSKLLSQSQVPAKAAEPKNLLVDQVIAADTDYYFAFGAPAKANVVLNMTGTGDADIAQVTLASSTDSVCDSQTSGTSGESCSFVAPTNGASYIAKIHSNGVESKVSLTATITKP